MVMGALRNNIVLSSDGRRPHTPMFTGTPNRTKRWLLFKLIPEFVKKFTIILGDIPEFSYST